MTTPPGPLPTPDRPGAFQRLQHWQLTRHVASPVTSPEVHVERDLPVPMGDGTVLLTDHWAPAQPMPGAPVLLIRTPYGRVGSGAEARAFAERGHHVVVQSCRGHFGSGGDFEPFFDEASDGLDCVAWVEAQDWFGGSIHTYGPSYVGLTQWALTTALPASVQGMVISISARSFVSSIVHHRGGFGMETAVTWNVLLASMEDSPVRQLATQLAARGGIRRGSDAIPPTRAVERATGHDPSFYQDWLAHDEDDPWWQPTVFGTDPATVPPLVLVAGFYDLFGHAQVEDFVALRAAGRPVRLVAAPWTHLSQGISPIAVEESLRQMADVDGAHARPAVRIRPIGSSTWLEFDSWPPPGHELSLHPHDDGSLRPEAPERTGELTYAYDPADPTPMAGGRSLNPWTAGRRNQKEREERDDVIVFTSGPLTRDTLVAGEAVARVALASTNPTIDLFVRLCEVDGRGRSFNLADGYLRVVDDGATQRGRLGAVRTHEVRLGATAALVREGRRLRLQVSSGAHPLHLRNPGTDDPVRDFSRLVASEQHVHLGPEGTSLTLPVVGG
ncbi:MAG: CocE/NonD family hydrolase [Humibacillus sp.]|nr:CocE/NonD family hydrolase [Humibacillus sp.]